MSRIRTPKIIYDNGSESVLHGCKDSEDAITNDDVSMLSDWKSKVNSKYSFSLKGGFYSSLHEKPLFTLCYLLAYQVRKFIGLFEALKQETSTDKLMLDQIERAVHKFGKFFHNNLLKLLASEDQLPACRDKKVKFSSCFVDLNSFLISNDIIKKTKEDLKPVIRASHPKFAKLVKPDRGDSYEMLKSPSFGANLGHHNVIN